MSPTGDLLVTQFFLGKCPLELAQGPSCVALAWHKARGSTPFGVTVHVVASMHACACFGVFLLLWLSACSCFFFCFCLAASVCALS